MAKRNGVTVQGETDVVAGVTWYAASETYAHAITPYGFVNAAQEHEGTNWRIQVFNSEDIQVHLGPFEHASFEQAAKAAVAKAKELRK